MSLYGLTDRVANLFLRTFGSKNRYANVFGYSMPLNISEGIQKMIYLDQFEMEEVGWIADYLKPGMTFIDVGANVGFLSLLGASRVGSAGKVISFEPSPYAIDRLKAAIRRNHITQITPVASALGEQPGKANLLLQDAQIHSPSLVQLDQKLLVSSVEVNIITLDDYLEANKIDHVDLLKIDVEGFEPNALRGAARAFKKGIVDALLCELHEYWLVRNNSSVQQLRELIASLGFHEVKTAAYPSYQNSLFLRR